LAQATMARTPYHAAHRRREPVATAPCLGVAVVEVKAGIGGTV